MIALTRQRKHRLFLVLGLMVIAIGPLSILTMGVLALGAADFSDVTLIASPVIVSLFLVFGTLAFALPASLLVAVNLVEKSSSSWARKPLSWMLSWLSAIPAPVWGLAGLTLFIEHGGLRGSLAFVLTLASMLIPPISLATARAIKAVPKEIRRGGLTLGARPFELYRWIVLPAAMPRLAEISLLSAARALGEVAVLLMLSRHLAIPALPTSLMEGTLFPHNHAGIDTGTAAALLWILVLALCLTAYLLRRILEKKQT